MVISWPAWRMARMCAVDPAVVPVTSQSARCRQRVVIQEECNIVVQVAVLSPFTQRTMGRRSSNKRDL